MDYNLFKSLIILKCMACVLMAFMVCFQVNEKAYAVGDFETRMIYHPINKNIAPVRMELQNKLQDTYFYSGDGVKLNAWYIKAQGNKPTVIYCHGQGENVSLWQDLAQVLADNGYGVFMLDYRGHGRSQGNPTESGLYRDLESAIKYLKDYEHLPQNNLVLWGRSLGGAVVADIASRDRFKGVILDSTFTNIRNEGLHLVKTGILEGKGGFWSGMASKFVKYMPLTQKFDTEHKIYKIDSPLLIAHSVNDTTVPVKMSYELASHNPKAQLFICKTGSHHSSEWIMPKVLEFLGYLN